SPTTPGPPTCSAKLAGWPKDLYARRTGDSSKACRQRNRASVELGLHRMRRPVLVRPYAQCWLQNAPGWTRLGRLGRRRRWRWLLGGGFLVVVVTFGGGGGVPEGRRARAALSREALVFRDPVFVMQFDAFEAGA